MNEVIKAMEERRSIRRFRPELPEKKDIGQILEAGLFAASGRGRQAGIAIAVTDRAMRDRIAEANRKIGGWDEGYDPFYGAPAIIIVLADRACRTYVYDGSLMLGNMMLAAHTLGLGSVWIHRAREEFELPEFRQLLKDLGIEGDYEGIGHLALGYPDGEAPAPAPRRDGRVFFIE